MKLPTSTTLSVNKQKIFNLPIWLIVIVVVLLLAGGGYFIFFRQTSPVKTYDQFPVMLINNGKTAVYRELRVGKDKIENEIIISNLDESDSPATKIYEYIPKEVAKSAKDLKFDTQPQIIEDDPLIMWDLGPLEKKKPVKIKYSTLPILQRTQCVEKGYEEDVRKYNLNPYVFDDCYKYFGIKFEEAVERNKKIREEKEKDQVQLIRPGEGKYQEIQRESKEVITPKKASTGLNLPAKLNSKISREEAVAIVKKSFGAASDQECEAAFNNGDNGWRVVCNRQNYWVGPAGKYGTFYEFNYKFFFVSADGKSWTSKGEYARWQRNEGKDVRTFGAPMWGVK